MSHRAASISVLVMLARLAPHVSAFRHPGWHAPLQSVSWRSKLYSTAVEGEAEEASTTGVEAAPDFQPKSEFLKILQSRGFLHQCTDLTAVDEKLSEGSMVGAVPWIPC